MGTDLESSGLQVSEGEDRPRRPSAPGPSPVALRAPPAPPREAMAVQEAKAVRKAKAVREARKAKAVRPAPHSSSVYECAGARTRAPATTRTSGSATATFRYACRYDGRIPCSLPDRARRHPAGTPRSYAWPQPGTRFARPLRFRAENRKRTLLVQLCMCRCTRSCIRTPSVPPTGPARNPFPGPARTSPRRPVPNPVPEPAPGVVSASPRRRAKRPRCPVPPPLRWNPPAHRRATPSR